MERQDLADLFRKCAAGRRQLLRSLEGDERFRESCDALRLQAHTLDDAARVVEGELSPLYDWLPSWQWTKPMLHALYGTEEPS